MAPAGKVGATGFPLSVSLEADMSMRLSTAALLGLLVVATSSPVTWSVSERAACPCPPGCHSHARGHDAGHHCRHGSMTRTGDSCSLRRSQPASSLPRAAAKAPEVERAVLADAGATQEAATAALSPTGQVETEGLERQRPPVPPPRLPIA